MPCLGNGTSLLTFQTWVFLASLEYLGDLATLGLAAWPEPGSAWLSTCGWAVTYSLPPPPPVTQGHCRHSHTVLFSCAFLFLSVELRRKVKYFLYPCVFLKWKNQTWNARATCPRRLRAHFLVDVKRVLSHQDARKCLYRKDTAHGATYRTNPVFPCEAPEADGQRRWQTGRGAGSRASSTLTSVAVREMGAWREACGLRGARDFDRVFPNFISKYWLFSIF